MADYRPQNERRAGGDRRLTRSSARVRHTSLFFGPWSAKMAVYNPGLGFC